MNSRKIVISAVITLFLFSVSTAFAKITVISVKGKAAYKTGRVWKPLKRGITLPQGTKVSTGVRSWVKLKLYRNMVTVKPLSMMKIYENSRKKNRVRTRIGLRRGSVRAHVTRGKRVRTIFKISTPVATSSVRGTVEDVTHGPSGSVFLAPQGSFGVINRNGQGGIVFGRLNFNQPGNSPNPDPMFRQPFVTTGDPNRSGEELAGQQFTGSDNPEGTGGTTDAVKELTSDTGANVNINVQWPDVPQK